MIFSVWLGFKRDVLCTKTNGLYENERSPGLVNRYGESSKLPVRLKGLDPAKRYQLKEINLYPGVATTIPDNITFTGEFLMTIGFNPQLNLQRTSVVIQINEAP